MDAKKGRKQERGGGEKPGNRKDGLRKLSPATLKRKRVAVVEEKWEEPSREKVDVNEQEPQPKKRKVETLPVADGDPR